MKLFLGKPIIELVVDFSTSICDTKINLPHCYQNKFLLPTDMVSQLKVEMRKTTAIFSNHAKVVAQVQILTSPPYINYGEVV